jgi:hypothetical protein
MTHDLPTCQACGQLISTDDAISFSVASRQLTHFDCRRPRTLTPEERLLIATYCWDHVVAACPTCDRNYRLPELVSVIVDGDTHYCPFCHVDLIDSVRAHLYACTMLPARVRQRAHMLREAAQHVVKRSRELSGHADVQMRDAEDAIQSLRVAMRESQRRGAS